ncbi:DNase I-like protein [Tilletiaria anomala UBC 951]|uniref:DNase I-like protein n=1 Tax=Tilletiaria anomala (strain ATCC 24038 / CBS 436.72 / UBC 951) TaxID=1037660 RepID=A0A066W5H0_TILAU|nr:DNase I-like protein [Tilletiaria anomala UBC 951]KDN49217.1 DNase I-like protein [Tilletiaria anomala UBC 951]
MRSHYEIAESALRPSEHLKLAISVDEVNPPAPAPPSESGASASGPTAEAALSASPAAGSQETASRRVLAIILNVDAGYELGALLVLRQRASDGYKTASIAQCFPLVQGLACRKFERGPEGVDVSQQTINATAEITGSTAQSSAEADAVMVKTNAEASEVKQQQKVEAMTSKLEGTTGVNPTNASAVDFSITLGRISFNGTTRDATGLQDLFAVIEAQVSVAMEHASHSSGKGNDEYTWIAAYTDHMPAALVAPIFSRFTSSAFVPVQAPGSSAASAAADSEPLSTRTASPSLSSSGTVSAMPTIQHATASELKISIATWNVNGQLPPVSSACEPASSAIAASRPNGAPPPETDTQGIARWLRAHEESDIIVVGFQEFDLGSTAYLYYTPQREDAWTAAVFCALGRRAGEYTKLASRQLVGLFSMVLVRTSLADCIQDVDTCAVGVGLGGFVANKGAVGIRFRFRERDAPPFDTGRTFCFVNAHLSAFEGVDALERRRWDWNEIMKRLNFELDISRQQGRLEGEQGIGKLVMASDKSVEIAPPPPTHLAAVAQMKATPTEMGACTRDVPKTERDKHRRWRRRWAKERKEWLDERREWLDGKTKQARELMKGADWAGQDGLVSALETEAPDALRIQLGVLDHDIIFFSGDLNYRLNIHINEAKKMIKKRQYATLLKFDQLNAERSIGAVFRQGWHEGLIAFSPTYKFDLGTNVYDTSEKQRTPAWCDRVLWHTPMRISKDVEKLAEKAEDDDTDEEEDRILSSVGEEELVRHEIFSE